MSDPSSHPNSAINILVVDDDPDLCQLLREILSEYEVDVLHDGHQVSAKLAGKDYQILISDLHMPSFTGLELLEVLKPHYPDLEILLLTGGGSVETAVEAMKLGAAEFLLKPVRVIELQAAIARAVKRLEIGRENRLLKDIHEKHESLVNLRESVVTLITHELRTPLTSLKFLKSEFMQKHEQLPDFMKPLLDIFGSSLNSLELLADDLNCLGEEHNKKLSLVETHFAPTQLLRETIAEVKHRLQDRNLTVDLENESEFEWTGDSRRVKQILTELINNAVRATPDGGTIRLGAYRDGTELMLEVVDSGVGIPKHQIPLVFEPFKALQPLETHHSSESAHLGGGLGIGLTIIKDIVSRMGGTIGIVSDAGQGCMVEVRIPEFASSICDQNENAETETEKPETNTSERQPPPVDGEQPDSADQSECENPLEALIHL